MSTPPLSTTPSVEVKDLFKVIKQCIDYSDGFYITRIDGTKALITTQNGSLSQKTVDTATKVLFAPQPSINYSIYEGLKVYYAGYDSTEGVFMCYQGRISSLKEEGDQKVFTIDGSNVSQYHSVSPVFTYDKSQKFLYLIGIILKKTQTSAKEERAILFSDKLLQAPDQEKKLSDESNLGEERGVITVEQGGFKGSEVRTKGGGPRSIKINGPNVENTTYNLSYEVDGKSLNPHHLGAYNSNQTKLYEKALKGFVKAFDKKTIPESYEFECYNQTFTAKK